jgi:hypothetical protein
MIWWFSTPTDHEGCRARAAGVASRRRDESDTKVHRGRITKQGRQPRALGRRRSRPEDPSRATRVHQSPPVGSAGYNIAKVAAAGELLTLVFYGLRDGHIRCLTPRRAA